MVEHSLGVHEVEDLISSWVIPKPLKMILDDSFLNARHSKILDQGNMAGSRLLTVKCDPVGCYINVPAM